MKLHRIFIAINLPEGVKNELLAYQAKWPELPARWTSKENLHLTLAFLGNTSDDELAEIRKAMQAVGERHSRFGLKVIHLQYGPDAKRPRMIWALIEESPELLELQKDVMRTLHTEEEQNFIPHLTLARLRTFELQRMEDEELPEVNEDVSISFQVNSIEVMTSILKRSGAQYTVVQSFPFLT